MKVPFISKQGAENAALISLLSGLTQGLEVTGCSCAFVCFLVSYLCNRQKAAMSNTLLGLVGCEWACSVLSLKH